MRLYRLFLSRTTKKKVLYFVGICAGSIFYSKILFYTCQWISMPMWSWRWNILHITDLVIFVQDLSTLYRVPDFVCVVWSMTCWSPFDCRDLPRGSVKWLSTFVRPSVAIFDKPTCSIDSQLKLIRPRDFIARFYSNGTSIYLNATQQFHFILLF